MEKLLLYALHKEFKKSRKVFYTKYVVSEKFNTHHNEIFHVCFAILPKTMKKCAKTCDTSKKPRISLTKFIAINFSNVFFINLHKNTLNRSEL